MSEAIRKEWQQAEELKNQGQLHEAATRFSRVLRLLREEVDDGNNRVSTVVGQLEKRAEAEVSETCNTMKSASPYVVLALEPFSAVKDVKKAYRKMALKYHPVSRPLEHFLRRNID